MERDQVVMEEEACRIDGYDQLDESKICYWKIDQGYYLIHLPGVGIGGLPNHKVEEHEDGSISVTPSIYVTVHQKDVVKTRHGYLTRGRWKEV